MNNSDILDIYLQTHLWFLVDRQRVDLGILSKLRDLPSLLYMVSAENPMDCPMSDEENAARHQSLVIQAKADKTLVAEGWGELDGHEEAMVLVSANGLNYGKQYNQRAIFVIDLERYVLDVQLCSSGESVRQRCLGLLS